DIEATTAEKDRLSKQFFEVRNEVMPSFDEHRTTCKMCGQELPADQIEEIRANYQKEVEKFNQDKATKLEDIQVKGKEKAMKIKDIEEMVEAFEKQKLDINSAIGKLEKGIADLDESIAQIQTEIKSIKDDQTPFEDTELGQKLTKEGKNIQAKIDAGDAN